MSVLVPLARRCSLIPINAFVTQSCDEEKLFRIESRHGPLRREAELPSRTVKRFGCIPPPPLPYSTVSLPISAVFFLDSFFFRPALVSSQPTRTAVTSSPPKMRVSHRSSVGRGESPAVSTCRCLYLSIRLGWKSRERSAISGGSSCRCGSPRPWGSPLCTDPNFPPATNAHYSERCPPPYRSPCRSYTTMFLG
jgi:hypothetical protein